MDSSPISGGGLAAADPPVPSPWEAAKGAGRASRTSAAGAFAPPTAPPGDADAAISLLAEAVQQLKIAVGALGRSFAPPAGTAAPETSPAAAAPAARDATTGAPHDARSAALQTLETQIDGLQAEMGALLQARMGLFAASPGLGGFGPYFSDAGFTDAASAFAERTFEPPL